MAAARPGLSTGEFMVANASQYAGQFKKVEPGARAKTVLVTWSRSKTRLSPTTREDGLKRLGDALGQISQEKFKGDTNGAIDVKQVSLAVFLEPHFSNRGEILQHSALPLSHWAHLTALWRSAKCFSQANFLNCFGA